MTDPLFDASDGTTPLDNDEAEGLRLSWVRTRRDLNEAERDNILDARRSVRVPSTSELLDDMWLRDLHRRMFGAVWSWAGRYRSTERNIGIEPAEIGGAVKALTSDCAWWIEQDDLLDAVARFHHRLVLIHPFPNGNGRHARAAADYLALSLQLTVPSWGAGSQSETAELRGSYLKALRAADRDNEDLALLISFMWG